MTSTEFIAWVEFLNWRDTEEFRPVHYYLAQIAAQIERGQVKNPSSSTIQKKMLKFTSRQPSQKEEGAASRSKSFWLAMTKSGKRPPEGGG